MEDLSEGRIDIESFENSDLSVNWSRYSIPSDVRFRANAKPSDGCISFTVADASYEKLAMTCHAPLPDNYSHAEIRWLREGETTEPSPGRDNPKSKTMKAARLKWRTYIAKIAKIEIYPQ